MRVESVTTSSGPSDYARSADVARKLAQARQTMAAHGGAATNPSLALYIDLSEKNLQTGNFTEAERLAREATRAAQGPETKLPGQKPQQGEKPQHQPTRGEAPTHPSTPAPEALLGKEKASHTYQDASADAFASYRTPTSMTPGQASLMVPLHESGHLYHAMVEASMSGRRLVQAMTIIHWRIDPRTGEMYAAGGQAITKMGPKTSPPQDFTPLGKRSVGSLIDLTG